jgi:hypothetical protein
VRDEGMVFHVEAFVVTTTGTVSISQLTAAMEGCREFDWKVQDVVIIPVNELPADIVHGAEDAERASE